MPITLTGNSGGQGLINSGTVQNTTSGTAIDFTGIPATAKRVTVMFNNVSTSGSDAIMLQVGAGSIVTSGYIGSCGTIRWAAVSSGTTQSNSAGFNLISEISSTYAMCGIITLCRMNGNNWVESGTLATTNSDRVGCSGGTLSLSGALDRLRITTTNGTDTFDGGSINILYE